MIKIDTYDITLICAGFCYKLVPSDYRYRFINFILEKGEINFILEKSEKKKASWVSFFGKPASIRTVSM